MNRLTLSALLCLAPSLVLAGPQPAVHAAAPGAPAAAASPGGDTIYAYLTRDGATFKAPLFAGESEVLPVATIDGDAITLRELNRALAGAHGANVAQHAGKKDFRPILDRLVEARLIAREARSMGIGELPEFKDAVENMRQNIGRELLQADVLKDVKPDAAEVEQLYKQAARQWKVQSLLIPRHEDATHAAAQLRAGKKFEDVAKRIVAEKKGKGSVEAQPIGRSNGLPPVLAVLDKLKVGQVSDPLKLSDGFAVMKVTAIGYPDDPKAREEANQASLARQRKAALKRYYDALVKRHAKVDEALLKALDFEAAKPGLAALEKDARPLARFDQGKPVTVADLTEALKRGFYHGVEGAIKEKKVNREKWNVFDGLLSQRVVPLEVKRVGLEAQPEFKERFADSENGLLFSKFVEKAVLPELKIDDARLKAYYAEHKKEYAYPTFYKVESIAFTSLAGAEGAVKQLRGGTDFKWLNANADGQVKASDRKLGLDGTLAATALPKELQTLLGGAKKGDFRLHADDANHQYYAIHVLDVVGAAEQPFPEVKDQIGQKVFQETLTASIKGWAEKLRKASQVKILLTKIGS